MIPGCSTVLGYSTTTGIPCSGVSTAIYWLAGCTSTRGYSTATGMPCNGTSVVTGTTPGLPTTAGDSNAPVYIAILALSGLTLLGGSIKIAQYARVNK
jgi:hypothetical protein